MEREQKAKAWAANRMKEGQWVDDCHWVRSGFGIWQKSEYGHHCTCIEVPRSYARYLPPPPQGDER